MLKKNITMEWCRVLTVVALVESADVNWIYLFPVKKARKRKLIRAKQKYIICYAIQLRQKSNPNAPPSLLFKSHTYTRTNSPTHWIGIENSIMFAFFELTSSETSKKQQQQQNSNSYSSTTSSSRLPLPSNQCVGSEEHVDKV